MHFTEPQELVQPSINIMEKKASSRWPLALAVHTTALCWMCLGDHILLVAMKSHHGIKGFGHKYRILNSVDFADLMEARRVERLLHRKSSSHNYSSSGQMLNCVRWIIVEPGNESEDKPGQLHSEFLCQKKWKWYLETDLGQIRNGFRFKSFSVFNGLPGATTTQEDQKVRLAPFAGHFIHQTSSAERRKAFEFRTIKYLTQVCLGKVNKQIKWQLTARCISKIRFTRSKSTLYKIAATLLLHVPNIRSIYIQNINQCSVL